MPQSAVYSMRRSTARYPCRLVRLVGTASQDRHGHMRIGSFAGRTDRVSDISRCRGVCPVRWDWRVHWSRSRHGFRGDDCFGRAVERRHKVDQFLAVAAPAAAELDGKKTALVVFVTKAGGRETKRRRRSRMRRERQPRFARLGCLLRRE